MISESIKTSVFIIATALFFITFVQSESKQSDKSLAKWLEEARTYCKTQCQTARSCDLSECQLAYLNGRAAASAESSSAPDFSPGPVQDHQHLLDPPSGPDPTGGPKQRNAALTFQPSGKRVGPPLDGADYERAKKLCDEVCPECTLDECTDMFVSGMAYGSEHKQEIEQHVPVPAAKDSAHSSPAADTSDLNSQPESRKSAGDQSESSKPDASYLAAFKKFVVDKCAAKFPHVDLKKCQGIFIAGTAVTGGVAALLLAPYALAAAGFTQVGIAAHSIGAFLMSVATQWGVGGVLVAALQSAGAAGVGVLTGLAGTIGGAIAGYFW